MWRSGDGSDLRPHPKLGGDEVLPHWLRIKKTPPLHKGGISRRRHEVANMYSRRRRMPK